MRGLCPLMTPAAPCSRIFSFVENARTAGRVETRLFIPRCCAAAPGGYAVSTSFRPATPVVRIAHSSVACLTALLRKSWTAPSEMPAPPGALGSAFLSPAAAHPPPGAIRFSEILFIFEDIYSHTMERKLIWSEAGIPGLILGLATAVCFYLTSLLGNALLNGIVWVAKLAGCICLMYFFMKKFVSIHSGADNRDSFRFGVIVALLSAFIYSVSFYIFTVYIKPDMFDAALSAVMDNYSSILDTNSLEQIENLIPKLPAIGFFSNLIYCFLYGTIVSAIISRSVPSTNPFDNDTPDEQ